MKQRHAVTAVLAVADTFTCPTTDRCAAVSSSPGGFADVAQSGGGGNDDLFGNTAV